MSREDKPSKDAVDEIFATFEAAVDSELRHIEEMRKENDLSPTEAAQLRLALRQFAESLRLSLNGNIPEFARKPSQREYFGKSRNEIARNAMSEENENPLLQDGRHAINLAADKAVAALANIKQEDPWRGVGKMFLLTVACYFMLFIIDYSGNTAKRTECDTQGKIEAACAKKEQPVASLKTAGAATNTTKADAGAAPCIWESACSGSKPASSQKGDKKDDCAHIPGKFCDRIGYSFSASPHDAGSAQGVALKSLALLFNLLFVLSLGGLVLGILRTLGIHLGDKLVDMLLDGLNEGHGKSGGGAPEGGKAVASGLSTLLIAKIIIGAIVATAMGIAAVNSYQKDRELHTNNNVVEKHIETYKEVLAPIPPNQDLKNVLEQNSELLRTIKELAAKPCTGRQESCPQPPWLPQPYALYPGLNYSPSNKVSLLDEKAANALGVGFGVGIRQVFGDGNQDLRDRVKGLEEEKEKFEKKAEDLQTQMAMYCIDLVKFEYEVKQDLRSIQESAVVSAYPGHSDFNFKRIKVDCQQIVANKCNNPANANTEVCRMTNIPK